MAALIDVAIFLLIAYALLRIGDGLHRIADTIEEMNDDNRS